MPMACDLYSDLHIYVIYDSVMFGKSMRKRLTKQFAGPACCECMGAGNSIGKMNERVIGPSE